VELGWPGGRRYPPGGGDHERPELTHEGRPLADEIGEALVGDVDPERLDGFRFAQRILPVFRLVRALFSQNEVDTCLKLMLLHELTRTVGRWSLERIRSHAGFLDPSRVEALVRSLRDGGWLDLRESDHTYALSPHGLHLLSVLHAADFDNLAPANALARAAQNAAFGATLEGASPEAARYLLEQLLVLLEDQVEQARIVLQQGRPYRMIDWNRREHRRQLETIQQVLTMLQERLDASSRVFHHVVRLHDAMQEIVRLHTGIHNRLREWNVDRLYTAEAGYSVPELLEAILGAEDAVLRSALDGGILQGAVLPPTLTFEEVKERIHGARRKLPSQMEEYVYSTPEVEPVAPWAAADLDPAAALRNRLTELFRNRTAVDPPLEIDVWADDRFPEATWRLALLSRLHAGDSRVALDDGRVAEVELATPLPRGVATEDLLTWLVEHEALRPLSGGLFARVKLRLAAGEARADAAAGVPEGVG
jgi:hypothetical protein